MGSLEAQAFGTDTFDAVTLHHVIEHVPDPARTLNECRRVLKRGGRLVVSTPNAASLGHREFGQDWRGLETPRHLHVFSMNAMHRILRTAGFEAITIQPEIGDAVIYESVMLRRGRKGPFTAGPRDWSASLYARWFALIELCLVKWRPASADLIVAIAVKQ
jgi:SAM-dependent methyltransferase